MKFCPVVPGICSGQVDKERKEKKKNKNNKKRSKNNKSPKRCLGDLIMITYNISIAKKIIIDEK